MKKKLLLTGFFIFFTGFEKVFCTNDFVSGPTQWPPYSYHRSADEIRTEQILKDLSNAQQKLRACEEKLKKIGVTKEQAKNANTTDIQTIHSYLETKKILDKLQSDKVEFQAKIEKLNTFIEEISSKNIPDDSKKKLLEGLLEKKIELYAPPSDQKIEATQADVDSIKSKLPQNLKSCDDRELEKQLLIAELNEVTKNVESLTESWNLSSGNTISQAALNPVLKVFGVDLHGKNYDRALVIAMVLSGAVLAPFVESFRDMIKNSFNNSLLPKIKSIFGGINYEILAMTNNCYNLFTSMQALARTGQVYASREVANAMRARRPAPDMLENAEEPEVDGTASGKEANEKACAFCQKSTGTVEFYFDCGHGMHPQCAKVWLSKPAEHSLHCPKKDCAAIRKFDIMQPDLRITGMLEKLNSSGPAASEIIKIRAAQKQIAMLIRKLDKRSNDNNAMYKQKLLAAIYQDLENLYKVLSKQKTFKDFCNQEALEQITIFAHFGQNSCTTLKDFILGTSNDANIKLHANNNGMIGGGMVGNQGFGGLGGF